MRRNAAVRYFDTVADQYFARYAENSPGGYAFRIRKARIRELLEDVRGQVLDVGCGPGVLVDEVLRLGSRCIGVDASPRMVAQAQRRFGKPGVAQFHLADAAALPFASATFDAVMCIGVIDRLPCAEAALAEFGRVLRAGGALIASFPNIASPYAYWRSHVYYRGCGYLRGGLARLRGAGRRPDLASATRLWRRAEAERTVSRLVGTVQTTVYYNFAVVPSPLEELFPAASLHLAQQLDGLRTSRLAWLGTGFIIKAVKR